MSNSSRHNEIESKLPPVIVDRVSLTLEGRHKHCSFASKDKAGLIENFKKNLKTATFCSKDKAYSILKAKLPILDCLIGYKWKEWLIGDVIAGITVAILHIPQGMAFALLANLPPICGIYMAFFQTLIYAIFGTSRHCSMGAFAVLILMTGKVVNQFATIPTIKELSDTLEVNATEFSTELTANASLSLEGVYTPIQVATIVTFMVGFWEVALGLLQLGSLSVFLSDMLVSGFTTAAAFHVLTSQIYLMLGIQIPGHIGPLKIIYTYIDIFRAIPSTNPASAVITIVTLMLLVLSNEILKPIISKHTKIPLPIELIVVILGTAASYFGHFSDSYGVNIVGEIPTGLPPPALPPLELFGKVAIDSLVIAIVGYTISYSLSKIFAAQHGYTIDATQELYAQGITNIISSFFASAPTAASLTRSLVQSAVGGVTQMTSIVCCAVLLFVLLFIGPVFKTLPNAVLAAIIAVALKGMFLQVRDVKAAWSVSRIDAAIWIATFAGVVVIDIDFGLLIGVVFSMLVLLRRNQRPVITRVGRIIDTEVYLDMETYPEAKQPTRMDLIRIVGAIHFANRETIRNSIMSQSKLDPRHLLTTRREKSESDLEDEARYLILDLSGLSYVDSSGGNFLEEMRLEYNNGGVSLCLAGLSETVVATLKRNNSLKHFHEFQLYHSLHDAVIVLSS